MLKLLIGLTIAITFLGAAFPQVAGWLALSRAGIENLYFWQLISYAFLEGGGLSFGFLLQLGFNMYILWMFGSSLIERSHPARFLLLYLGSAFIGGVSILPFHHAFLAGSTIPIYAILTAWMMLNPGAQLQLFFAIPFKAHFLIVGLIAFTLFLDLSSGNWPFAIALIAGVFYAYLFALITWRQQGPFSILRPFERRVLRFLEKKGTLYQPSKIYDIQSGAPVLDDEQFMDAMLARVSKYGEESLTPLEKRRMQEISKKKK